MHCIIQKSVLVPLQAQYPSLCNSKFAVRHYHFPCSHISPTSQDSERDSERQTFELDDSRLFWYPDLQIIPMVYIVKKKHNYKPCFTYNVHDAIRMNDSRSCTGLFGFSSSLYSFCCRRHSLFTTVFIS